MDKRKSGRVTRHVYWELKLTARRKRSKCGLIGQGYGLRCKLGTKSQVSTREAWKAWEACLLSTRNGFRLTGSGQKPAHGWPWDRFATTRLTCIMGLDLHTIITSPQPLRIKKRPRGAMDPTIWWCPSNVRTITGTISTCSELALQGHSVRPMNSQRHGSLRRSARHSRCAVICSCGSHGCDVAPFGCPFSNKYR